jgi:CheY-like chemotaxis protein
MIHSERLANVRQHAQLLLESARDHEGQLEALVVAGEGDVGHSEAAVSRAADGLNPDEVRHLLAAQLERSAVGAAGARRRLLGAQELHAAASRLLQRLDGDGRAKCPNAVLVADDYGDVRELLACALEDAGFVVRTAANGLEAFLAAYEMRPAVIVMDLSMPVLDGIEATRLIKAVEVTRDARVIAYTGNGSFDANPTRTLFAAVLHKPATPDMVLAAVRQVAAL